MSIIIIEGDWNYKRVELHLKYSQFCVNPIYSIIMSHNITSLVSGLQELNLDRLPAQNPALLHNVADAWKRKVTGENQGA